MVTYKPITFASGETITPGSASESISLRQRKLAEERASQGIVSTPEKTAEAERQGLSTTGGVYTESRGQKLAREAGQTTAFADDPRQFSGYRDESGLLNLPNAYGSLPDYRPPQSNPTATPMQNALAKANYDLSFVKQALSASQKETERIKTTTLSEMERSTFQREQEKTKEKGDQLSFGIDVPDFKAPKTKVNPAYAKLTENEKILNEQRKKEGKSFISETITAESGRSPMQRQMTKEQRMAAQDLSQTVSILGDEAIDVLSTNFDLLTPSQKGVARDYINTMRATREREMAEEISKGVSQELNAQERQIRADLNMSPTDELTFDKNGQPLVNKKPVTENAKERARQDVQDAKDEWLEQNNEKLKNDLARIRSAYTIDGNISDKGLKELADREREYNKERDERFKEIDENLQEYENKQNSSQAKIDMAIAQANSPEGRLSRQLAQDKATGAYNIQLEQAKIGNEIGFSAAIKEYERRQDFEEKEPKYADIASALDTKIMRPSFDKANAFDTVVEAFDNDVTSTEKYMKSRGFLDKDIAEQKSNYQINVLGYDEETVGLSALNNKKQKIIKTGGQNDGGDVYQYIKELKKEFGGTTAGDKIVSAALRELQDSTNMKPAGRIVIEDELSDLQQATVFGATAEVGALSPQFESLINSAVDGFISETEFGKAIKYLPDQQQRALITEKGMRMGASKGTEEEQRIITQVMRQLPTKLKDAILEKRERQKEILADVRDGRTVQDIVDELKGFIVTNNDNLDLAKYLRVKAASDPNFELENISAPINLDNPLGAVSAIENALLPAVESEFSQASTDSILRTSDELIGLINEVGDEFMGKLSSGMFEAGKATIPDSVLDSLGLDTVQKEKAQRLAARLAKLMAVDRRGFGGTAVTETELSQLKPFLTDMKDQPRTAKAVLRALSEDALLRHNSARRQKGLPTLDTAETFLNDDLKLRVYENEALVSKLKSVGFSETTIDLFRNATPQQRQQVLDLIDQQAEGQEGIGTDITEEPAKKYEFIPINAPFNNKLEEVALDLGVDRNDLEKVIKIETAGTFNPAVRNPKSSATGLIQFMADTAKKLGTTTEELAKMDRVKQMDFVKKYLSDKGELNSAEDIYMAVFAPAALGKPDEYVVYGKEVADVNPAISQGRPQITVADIKNYVKNYI